MAVRLGDLFPLDDGQRSLVHRHHPTDALANPWPDLDDRRTPYRPPDTYPGESGEYWADLVRLAHGPKPDTKSNAAAVVAGIREAGVTIALDRAAGRVVLSDPRAVPQPLLADLFRLMQSVEDVLSAEIIHREQNYPDVSLNDEQFSFTGRHADLPALPEATVPQAAQAVLGVSPQLGCA